MWDEEKARRSATKERKVEERDRRCGKERRSTEEGKEKPRKQGGQAREKGDARKTVQETDTGGRRREPRGKEELL